MTAIKASDLPVGSLVAWDMRAWIKERRDCWWTTGVDSPAYDWQVQDALDEGAKVYREGLA